MQAQQAINCQGARAAAAARSAIDSQDVTHPIREGGGQDGPALAVVVSVEGHPRTVRGWRKIRERRARKVL